MLSPPPDDPFDQRSVTHLLQQVRDGDRLATADLVERVYGELRGLARGLCGERDQTMSATVLVHEAFVRMRGAEQVDFATRRQFYAFAAKIMRHVLIDHARYREAQKRGGEIQLLPLDEALDVVGDRRFDWIELDEALDKLAARDPRLAKLVELKFFGGLSNAESAIELEVSESTVQREWRLAKAWLQRELKADD